MKTNSEYILGYCLLNTTVSCDCGEGRNWRLLYISVHSASRVEPQNRNIFSNPNCTRQLAIFIRTPSICKFIFKFADSWALAGVKSLTRGTEPHCEPRPVPLRMSYVIGWQHTARYSA